MEPTASSTPHSGQGIRHMSLMWYESTTPVHFKAFASANIPDLSAPGWYVINQELATLAARPYR